MHEASERVVLRNVSWELFQQILDTKGEDAGPRLAYLDGSLELMSPSREHERIRTMIGPLLEGYAAERGIDLNGFGSWTLLAEDHRRGIEPDECYVIGVGKEVPDLAIEVDWSRSTINKLEIYRGLGVREVWRWFRGRIRVYVLVDGAYVESSTSALFADLDVVQLASFVGPDHQTATVEAFRAAIRGPT